MPAKRPAGRRCSARLRAASIGSTLRSLYGNGTSEETIGRHLSVLSPRPHVSTKVRLDRDDMADIAGAIERSLEQSLKRLQLERVALLQLHNQIGTAIGDRPPLSPRQVLGAVADTFDRLKEGGSSRPAGSARSAPALAWK